MKARFPVTVSSRTGPSSSPDPPAGRAAFTFDLFTRLTARRNRHDTETDTDTRTLTAGQMSRNDSHQMKECLTQKDNGNTADQPSSGGHTDRHSSSETRGSMGNRSSASNEKTDPSGERESRKPEAHGARRTSESESMDTSDASGSTYPISNLKKIQFFPTETLLCKDHTVMVHVNWLKQGAVVPFQKDHVWDNHHVKLPHMDRSHGSSSSPSRWRVIQQSLLRLTQGHFSIGDLENTIMSYNSSNRGKWTFEALQHYGQHLHKLENNLHLVIPKMASLAIELPSIIQQPIPLLRQNHTHAITLSQLQISCLLANAFFSTFPHRNSTKPGSEYSNYPTINFSSLFGSRNDPGKSALKAEKLRAILHYFDTVTRRDSESKTDGLVTFQRISIHPSDLPKWKNEKKLLRNLHITPKGSIECEGTGMLQVDFANKYIGGGVLGGGLVQEEILFLMSPELIVARLFTEKLAFNECLRITGPQIYNTSSGYSQTFSWAGPYSDDTKRDEWKRRYRQIVAIDALDFKNPREQFTRENITRELNKAYVGFSGHPKTAIATGNWGCGAFKGNPELKALLQLMAAAVAERDMAYFTFGNQRLANEVQRMHETLSKHRVTVDKLYKLLMDYSAQHSREHHAPKDLYRFIREKIGHSNSSL